MKGKKGKKNEDLTDEVLLERLLGEVNAHEAAVMEKLSALTDERALEDLLASIQISEAELLAALGPVDVEDPYFTFDADEVRLVIEHRAEEDLVRAEPVAAKRPRRRTGKRPGNNRAAPTG